MKVMIFIDHTNFSANIKQINEFTNKNREINFDAINNFIIGYLKLLQEFKDIPLTHIRTYLYTGEYTDNIISKIKKQHLWVLKNKIHPEQQDKKKAEFDERLNNILHHRNIQKQLFDKLKHSKFFEVRKKPLQCNGFKIFQKGVDVQIAVDLVANAFLQSYDIAVLFSGDVDLLESIRTVKNLGKQVILISHDRIVSKELSHNADLFIDLSKSSESILNKFTTIV